MQILLCVVSVLFGGLQMAASVSQMKSERKPISAVVMAIGSVMVITAVICNITAQWFDYIIAIFGCIAICAAAIWNGIKGKQFHISHHIVRILISIILAIGFVFI